MICDHFVMVKILFLNQDLIAFLINFKGIIEKLIIIFYH